MTNQNSIKENQINPDQPPVENLSNPEMSSFSCQEPTEEEELLY